MQGYGCDQMGVYEEGKFEPKSSMNLIMDIES